MKRSCTLFMLMNLLAMAGLVRAAETQVTRYNRNITGKIKISNPFSTYKPRSYDIALDLQGYYGVLTPKQAEVDQTGVLDIKGQDAGFGGIVRIKATALVHDPSVQRTILLSGEKTITIPEGEKELNLGSVELALTDLKPYNDPNPLAGLLYPPLLTIAK